MYEIQALFEDDGLVQTVATLPDWGAALEVMLMDHIITAHKVYRIKLTDGSERCAEFVFEDE